MIEIRKSQPEDLGEIMEIYKYARSFMAAHGNPNQWGRTNWPPESVIKNDIEHGDSYVCVLDGTIVGTFFYTEGKDVEPTYARIDDGEWLDESPYGVIHRIASNGKAKGILHEVLAWARKSCHHIRIDTYKDNTVMQNLLDREGFRYCGTIYVYEDNDPRMAYEIL